MVQERGRHVRFNQQRTQGGIVAGSGDVSPQMGLAGKYTAELAAATTAPAAGGTRQGRGSWGGSTHTWKSAAVAQAMAMTGKTCLSPAKGMFPRKFGP